jgi:membrane fusion protein (multidrug efflux system)
LAVALLAGLAVGAVMAQGVAKSGAGEAPKGEAPAGPGKGGPMGGAPPPPEVTLATVEQKTVPVEYEYVGVSEASKTVEVRARVQGFLETRDFQEGAHIAQGARLFTIDPRSFKADLQIAQARVEQAQSALKLAQQEVRRLQSVRDPGSIAQADMDQKLAAEANAAASLRLAKAQMAKAELDLSYTEVAAPLTGYVGKALKEIGSFVDSGQNSLLAVMQQVDPVYVSFQVTEKDFLGAREAVEKGLVALGAGVAEPYIEITLLDGSMCSVRGRLNYENASVNTQTGTVELRGTFENADRKIKPGQFVKVHVRGWERPNTLTVPQRSVSQSPQGAFVYVVGEAKVAERRPVRMGEWAGRDWIVLDGLKPGEQVILDGLAKVMMPGLPVNPVPAPPPSEPARAL